MRALRLSTRPQGLPTSLIGEGPWNVRRESDGPFAADRNPEPDQYALHVFLGKPRGVVFYVHRFRSGRNAHADNAIPAVYVCDGLSIGVSERTFEIVVSVDLGHVF